MLINFYVLYNNLIISSHYNSSVWNSPSNTSKRSWRPNATITNNQTFNTPSSMSQIVNARLGQGSMYGDNNSKPVSPDICLEYMWTENQNLKGYPYIYINIFKFTIS